MIEAGPYLEKIEGLLNQLLSEEQLNTLNSIESAEEAESNEVRQFAILQNAEVWRLLNSLQEDTNVSQEKFSELKEMQKKLSRAIGTIIRPVVDGKRLFSGGVVDHTR